MNLTLKIPLIVTFCTNLVACVGSSDARQIGDTNICIPDQLLLNLGASSDQQSGYDSDPDIYEALSIDANIVQQAIPHYQGQFGSGNDKRYAPLHITITRQKTLIDDIPAASQHDYFFSEPNPQLVGYQTDPNDFWEVYEIQPDQSRTHWGFCSHYLFDTDNHIQCKRSLALETLQFEYSVSRSNIDQYPKIDAYIREKVDTEWRCR